MTNEAANSLFSLGEVCSQLMSDMWPLRCHTEGLNDRCDSSLLIITNHNLCCRNVAHDYGSMAPNEGSRGAECGRINLQFQVWFKRLTEFPCCVVCACVNTMNQKTRLMICKCFQGLCRMCSSGMRGRCSASVWPSRPQLNLYAQKFDEFQGTLAKSNEIYVRFKKEMDNVGSEEGCCVLMEPGCLFKPLLFLDVGEDEEDGERVDSVEDQVRELQQGSEWHDGGGACSQFLPLSC